MPISLGSTVNNDVFIADLSIMPNILIGGYRLGRERQSTACLKNIITSLLYKKLPAELKFVLIDSLDSELSVYADIEKYYIAKTPGIDNPIITGTDNAIKTLNCLVQEMGNRYKILEELNVRKISDYNEKWNLELQNFCDAQGSKKYKSMPNIVCVINNYGDLMMAAKKEIEILIVRLARRAQAVGIHMVIATQHFLCDVVTQSIKANFPARIAFHVYEQKESLLIIDRPDAKRLNFWFEMLFSFNGETTRLECSRVRDDVIACICTFIKKQEDKDCDFKPNYLCNTIFMFYYYLFSIMSKVFRITPKRTRRVNGQVITPEMVITVTTRQHCSNPFYNGAVEVKEQYMRLYNFDYKKACMSVGDFTYVALD